MFTFENSKMIGKANVMRSGSGFEVFERRLRTSHRNFVSVVEQGSRTRFLTRVCV